MLDVIDESSECDLMPFGDGVPVETLEQVKGKCPVRVRFGPAEPMLALRSLARAFVTSGRRENYPTAATSGRVVQRTEAVRKGYFGRLRPPLVAFRGDAAVAAVEDEQDALFVLGYEHELSKL